jgi:hypothetical protein
MGSAMVWDVRERLGARHHLVAPEKPAEASR